MKKFRQEGSHVLALMVVMVLVTVVGLAGYRVMNSQKEQNQKSTPDNSLHANLDNWKMGCSRSGNVRMQHMPMDIDDISLIQPTGMLAAAHVTPIDHLYFYPKNMTERDAAPVYAMADGYVVELEDRGVADTDGRAANGALRIVVQHSCSTYSYYDLMTSISPSLYKKLKAGNSHVEIKAGEVIGRVGMQSLDTAMYDLDMRLPGFVNPDTYSGEPWKIHTDDFFSYFDEPLLGQMLALNPRKVQPYGGKIDYDIVGKLIGNWFQVGTNGYAGPPDIERTNSLGDTGYFSGHFSIAPDSVHPSLINLSFGDYQGKPQQFTAKAGSLDPALIGLADGVVEYELTEYKQPTFSVPVMGSTVQGTALLQVLDGNKMKLEIFPGKTAQQVSGFTDAAKIYER